MSYSLNHKRVVANQPPGVAVGWFVLFCLFPVLSGCVVTSVGKPAGHKCGPNCPGHHPAPVRSAHPTVTIPTDIPTPEPVPGPILETPQAATESKDWQPPAKISNTATAAPVRTVYAAPQGNRQQSAPNLLSALFPSLHSSPTSLQQQQLQQQQRLRQQQAQQQALKKQQIQAAQLKQRQNMAAQQSPTPWYDPLGLLGSAQPIPQSMPQQVAARQPVPSQPAYRSAPSPITQVSYDQPLPQPLPPKRLPPAETISYSRLSSTASPELHKPWNMDEFRPGHRTNHNPYRLVSDTGENAGRTPPPTIDLSRLTGNTSSSATKNASLAQSAEVRSRMPILGLGRELVKELRPSNDRKWSQNHAVLQTASFNGNLVTVHNVRYSKYENGHITTTRYYDATFDINDIRTIDLVIVPFRGAPRLAHVQSSFGFADGRHIGMSIEARYEEGEQYDALGSAMRQFELIYVFADERDLLRIGSEVNKNDVHIYRLKFEPSEVREMFVDALNRANALAAKPEFYHPLRNSCVTNLIAHINKGRPKSIPGEYRTLLPGLLDNYAYDLKLVDTTAKTFKEAKENAKANWLIEKYGDLEYFSACIRQNMY